MALEQQKHPSFVAIKCRCGRGLRAKWDQVGTEIRCWDCHEPVLVRMPNPTARLASRMTDRFKAAMSGSSLLRIAAVALLVTAALTIPWAGVGVAALILVSLAARYGEAIRRGDDPPEDAEADWWTPARPRSIAEALGCLLMVAGAVVPLWVVHAGLHRSPHLDPVTAGVLGLTWLVLPALMVGAFTRERGELTGARRVLPMLLRHGWLLIMATLIVPLGVLGVEAVLDLGFYLQGSWPFFAMEYMPIPGNSVIYLGVPHFNSQDFRFLPQGQFIRGYFQDLEGGYTFVGAIPASLSQSTRAGLDPSILGLLPIGYAIVRFVLAAFIVGGILAAYSVQARWLGLLTILEKMPRLEPAKAAEDSP